MRQRTFQPSAGAVPSQWFVVDARGQTLGRLAVNVARVLRGKHKAEYTPHLNTGDHVIVVNARDLVVTGKKLTDKIYDTYSGYPGGRRTRTLREHNERNPTFAFTHAVEGMLQHNSLGRDELKNLRVFADSHHKHAAQSPVPIAFGRFGEVIIVASNN